MYQDQIFQVSHPENPHVWSGFDIHVQAFFYILIPGLSRHKTSSPEDLLRLLQYGNGNRTQHPTDANKESSRSHAVFQVYIKQTGMFLGKKLERHSLNLKKCLSNFLITEESNFDERNGQEMFNWSEVHS